MKNLNRWGVELNGHERDKDVWKAQLVHPFDPYVESLSWFDTFPIVIRSASFDGHTDPKDVFNKAKVLFGRVNMAISASALVDLVTCGAVFEIHEIGPPSRYPIGQIKPAIWPGIRASVQRGIKLDEQGNIIEPPPAASKPQRLIHAAAHNPFVAQAMDYLSGNPGWVELYKAHEALRDGKLAPNATSSSDLKRFTHTANAKDRHREGKYRSPVPPMTQRKALSLMIRRLKAAAEEVLKILE